MKIQLGSALANFARASGIHYPARCISAVVRLFGSSRPFSKLPTEDAHGESQTLTPEGIAHHSGGVLNPRELPSS